MTTKLTCADCRELLPMFSDPDQRDRLSAKVRRMIGAHLDTCPHCDALYSQQREVSRELRAIAPLIGRADTPRLGAIWAAVQTEMSAPRPRTRVTWRGSARYSAVALVLMLVLAMPLILGSGQFVFALPVPPTPLLERDATEPGTLVGVAAVMTPQFVGEDNGETTDGRPTLPPQPRYAPTAVATDPP